MRTLSLPAALLLPGLLVAQPFYSPTAAAAGFGNLPTYWPFGQRTLQYQQVHDASSFTPALVGPVVRLRGRAYYATVAGSADLELFVAPSLVPASVIDLTFAKNELGAARVNVIARKVVSFPAMGAGVWGAPDLVFDVPYFAQPGQGLCWRVVIYSSTNTAAYGVDTFDGNIGAPSSSYPGCQHPLATQPASQYSIARAPLLGVPWFLVGISYVTARSLPAVLLVGTSTSFWGAVPLPYDLTALGAPGCMLVNDAALTVPGTTVAMASGRVQFQAIAPLADPTLVGKTLYTQVAFADAAANALGVFTTGGLANPIPAPRGIGFIASSGTAATYADAARMTDSGVAAMFN